MTSSKVPVSLGLLLILITATLPLTAVGEESNVSGRVVERGTERGIPAVVYFVRGEFSTHVRCDEDGRFSLYLPPGEYVWEAEAEGYQPGRGEVAVPEGEPVELLLQLTPSSPPEHNLFGVLLSRVDGSPLKGWVKFFLEGETVAVVESGEDGTFSLYLRPGTYGWLAGAEGYSPEDGRVTVPEEGSQRITISLSPAERPGGAVKGRITGPEGEGIAGVHVVAEGRPFEGEEAVRVETKSDERGFYALKLPFGEYVLVFEREGFLPERREVRLGEDMGEVELNVVLHPERPPFEWDRIIIEFVRIDEDSDGYPERIEVHMELDGVPSDLPDFSYIYEDENSDGYPERVEMRADLPREQLFWAIMILNYLLRSGEVPATPEEVLPGYDSPEVVREVEPSDVPLHSCEDEEGEEILDPAPKESPGSSEGAYAPALVALVLALATLLILSYLFVRRRDTGPGE